ncbi:MAG: hypothetical protein ISR65_15715 [Bacteriovoracaceae bacterium]|nr:hypothetical protein [Bacteriovoracaceae bacterium]
MNKRQVALVIIPFVGQIAFLISAVLCLIFTFLGMINAILGRYWEMPIVRNYTPEI